MLVKKTGAALAAGIALLMAPAMIGAQAPGKVVRGAQIIQGGLVFAERPTKRVGSAVELEQVLRSDFVGRVVIPRDANWDMVDALRRTRRARPLLRHADARAAAEVRRAARRRARRAGQPPDACGVSDSDPSTTRCSG